MRSFNPNCIRKHLPCQSGWYLLAQQFQIKHYDECIDLFTINNFF